MTTPKSPLADLDQLSPNGAQLLELVRAELIRYMVFSSTEDADAVTLWIAATHG